MGDVSRKMTTRTWQRPVRPDSERRDPEGGMTDRRDGGAADGTRPAPSLTNDPLTHGFMRDASSGAFLPEATAAPRPSLEEENPTSARLRAPGMADGDGWDSSSWRNERERGREPRRSSREPPVLKPSESWKREMAEAESQKSRRAAGGASHSSTRLIMEELSEFSAPRGWRRQPGRGERPKKSVSCQGGRSSSVMTAT